MNSNRTGGKVKESNSFGQSVDRAIAKSVQFSIDQFLNCWGEAEITSAAWAGDDLAITITLPFFLPFPSDCEGDWITTESELRAFREGIKKHYLKTPRVNRLSNLLFAEYVDFLRKFLRTYRFGSDVFQYLPKNGERRLAGRHSTDLTRLDEKALHEDVKTVAAILLNLKQLIRGWKRDFGRRHPIKMDSREAYLAGEVALENRIEEKIYSHFARATHLRWARFVFPTFAELPPRLIVKGEPQDKKFSNPASWSHVTWAVRIVQEKHFCNSGIIPPASKFVPAK